MYQQEQPLRSAWAHLNIGGTNPDGTRWTLSQADAIAGIESGKWSFYVARGLRVVRVVIATSRFGYKYLKTEADGEQPDNLLNLPECPWSSFAGDAATRL